MTLNDYANARGKVVITFTSLKYRTGESIPAGHPDFFEEENFGLRDLSGSIDRNGDWTWDGIGSPKDECGNQIRSVTATEDPETWDSLVGE